MSEKCETGVRLQSDTGVVYTEHSRLAANTPIASLWSYESRPRERGRRPVALNQEGDREYWLERTDPLLNTILPGTGVSLIVNIGDPWAAGRSLATSDFLPQICVVGPVTQSRILRVGRSVRAIGAAFVPTLAPAILGVPASALVDQIVPLADLWTGDDVETLLESMSRPAGPERLGPHQTRRAALSGPPTVLRDGLLERVRASGSQSTGQTAPQLIPFIKRRAGQVSIGEMARSQRVSRHLFARRFRDEAGLPPKLFARITRFQSLVNALLSTDVSQWAALSPAVGFYDQAHMINEFRDFTGSPPTVFFRPHGDATDPTSIQVRGRPSEWTTGRETRHHRGHRG
jgi:AraC-like DNA-binding protein